MLYDLGNEVMASITVDRARMVTSVRVSPLISDQGLPDKYLVNIGFSDTSNCIRSQWMDSANMANAVRLFVQEKINEILSK